MPVIARAVHPSNCNRPVSWAFGTRITGVVTPQTVKEAATMIKAAKDANSSIAGWLLDASAASDLEPAAKLEILANLRQVAGLGIRFVAIVPPRGVQISQSDIPPFMMPQGVTMRVFDSDRQAALWFGNSCVDKPGR